MALTKAPLFGLDAGGTIAGSIVFSKWKGRNYVRRHAVPSNPRSGLQVGMRAGFKFISQSYAALNAGSKADWKIIADKTLTTPLNAQMQASQRNLRINLGPIQDPNVAAGSSPSAPATFTTTPVPKGVNLAWTAGATAPEYSWMIFRSLSAITTPDISQLIAIVPAATLAFSDRGLITGTTYHYKIQGTTFAGAKGTASADTTGVPT